MQQVLCFGDSNTWGYNPENGERFPWGIRWTSILQQKLADKEIRIIEEGLCGRTTVFEDPLRQGRRVAVPNSAGDTQTGEYSDHAWNK